MLMLLALRRTCYLEDVVVRLLFDMGAPIPGAGQAPINAGPCARSNASEAWTNVGFL